MMLSASGKVLFTSNRWEPLGKIRLTVARRVRKIL